MKVRPTRGDVLDHIDTNTHFISHTSPIPRFSALTDVGEGCDWDSMFRDAKVNRMVVSVSRLRGIGGI